MKAKDFIPYLKLYHYTTFDNAMKIIIGKSLKFGRLPFMNDYLESNKIFGCSIHSDRHVLDNISEEILRYQQISLTKDTKEKKGFDISAMWGHYAEKNHGVCIVFNKEKLLITAKLDIGRMLVAGIQQESKQINKSYPILNDTLIASFIIKPLIGNMNKNFA